MVGPDLSALFAHTSLRAYTWARRSASRSPPRAPASCCSGSGRCAWNGAEASLRVSRYDVLGREVARLFEGGAGAGRVELRVPVGLTPDVYVVRATGTRFAETKLVR